MEKALIAEFDRLKTDGITERELQRAKNQFARDYIVSRLSIKEKASQLGHAEVIQKDIASADGEFDTFLKVSLDDVQRVAKKYFVPEGRMVMRIMPRGWQCDRQGRRHAVRVRRADRRASRRSPR